MWAPRAAARHSRRAHDSTQRIITPPAGNTKLTQETTIPTPDPNAITPGEFIAKWRASELKERSAAQEHFIDLCRLLGEPTPADADPTGDRYCFERGARRDSGGEGWADVWKRHCFAWEYKGKHSNLDATVVADDGRLASPKTTPSASCWR